MSANPQKQLSEERISRWGDTYLNSIWESRKQAGRSFKRKDYFTAYLYLFVVFNNLYSLLVRFDGRERTKIKAALEELPSEDVDRFYTGQYRELIDSLNDGLPEQFASGPERGAQVRGITDMKDYFLGKKPKDCVVHVGDVAAESASAEAKKRTLQEVAAYLLYTVRNNQFHAVKGPQRQADLDTLRAAYLVLHPIVDALTPITRSSLHARGAPH